MPLERGGCRHRGTYIWINCDAPLCGSIATLHCVGINHIEAMAMSKRLFHANESLPAMLRLAGRSMMNTSH